MLWTISSEMHASMLIYRSLNVCRLVRTYSNLSEFTMSSAPPAKWFDSLPAPISTPPQMSAKELHELCHMGQSESKVVVVDVRRADIEVCSVSLIQRHLFMTGIQGDQAALIPNAINLPAQSFHQTLPSLVPILSQ